MIWKLDYSQKIEPHRIGQTDSVTYIDFVCPNTIDEKILKALSTKKKLADQITGDNWKELFL